MGKRSPETPEVALSLATDKARSELEAAQAYLEELTADY